MAKQAKNGSGQSILHFQNRQKEFTVPLLNIWEELYTMEFISRDIRFQC